MHGVVRRPGAVVLVVMASCYLAPSVAAFASGLSHEVYHALPTAAQIPSEAGVAVRGDLKTSRHPRPVGFHQHGDDGAPHTHNQVVDGLLMVSHSGGATLSEGVLPNGLAMIGAHIVPAGSADFLVGHTHDVVPPIEVLAPPHVARVPPRPPPRV